MAKKRSLDELKALFRPQSEPMDSGLSGFDVDRRLLGEPTLVFYLFRDVFGFSTYGPYEKMRIGVQGLFRDVPFVFEWQKFGLRLFLPTDKAGDSGLARLLQVAVRDAIHRTKGDLERQARQQIEAGNVTLENKFHEFDGAYRFLREKAAEAYGQPSPPPVEHRDANGVLQSSMSQPFLPIIQGSYFATAMLHEYFSLLEHVFLLALAFTSFEPSNGGLRKAASERSWGTKLRTLIDIKSDPTAERLHTALLRVKDELRNPLAHGGVKVGGQSFYFHLKGYGALPSAFDEEPKIRWPLVRCTKQRFAEICALFDEFDTFLERGPTAYAMQYIKSGLDVAFDERSRDEYHEATSDNATFEALIERIGYLSDMHSNMDY